MLIVCSKRARKEIILDKKLNFIENNKIYWVDDITPNPSLLYFENKKKNFKVKKFNYIIAIGGGSVIDTAKVLLLIFSLKKKSINDIIGKITNLKINAISKLVAIPTTSGTGSEVTSYATVWDKKNKKKLSIDHEVLRPFLAIIDPVLTFNLSKENTINTGLDALNQAFDSLWNKNANRNTLMYAFKSIKLSWSSLAILNKEIDHKKSRINLAKASLYAGMCISKTRTSICHSISYPLTSYYKIPHGLACAFSMIAIINYINNRNKNFFSKLAISLNFVSGKTLEKKLKRLFLNLKVKKKIILSIENIKSLLLLKKYMQMSGRSDNFIYEINDTFLDWVLKKSYL